MTVKVRGRGMEASGGIGPLAHFYVGWSLVPGTNCSLTFNISYEIKHFIQATSLAFSWFQC